MQLCIIGLGLQWEGYLVFPSHCCRFCRRSPHCSLAKASIFMLVRTLEPLVQNQVGRFCGEPITCLGRKVTLG
jgi:hypothetical protein